MRGVAVGRGRRGRRPQHACLYAHFFEHLLEQLGEGVGIAGAEEREGAGLHLGRPVVGLRVEGVEKVFLDPVGAGGGKGG